MTQAVSDAYQGFYGVFSGKCWLCPRATQMATLRAASCCWTKTLRCALGPAQPCELLVCLVAPECSLQLRCAGMAPYSAPQPGSRSVSGLVLQAHLLCMAHSLTGQCAAACLAQQGQHSACMRTFECGTGCAAGKHGTHMSSEQLPGSSFAACPTQACQRLPSLMCTACHR